MQVKKILIVEDNPDMRAILSMRFKLNGYNIIEAGDGEEALNKAKQETPDLIILDLMIPKIDGFGVCRMLKSDSSFKNIPIIVLSALDQEYDRQKAASAGANAYFTKPFDTEVLLAKVKSMVS